MTECTIMAVIKQTVYRDRCRWMVQGGPKMALLETTFLLILILQKFQKQLVMFTIILPTFGIWNKGEPTPSGYGD